MLIAREAGRALNDQLLPIEASISVVTLAELQAGVLSAADPETRVRRSATLEEIAGAVIHPAGVDAARIWARLRVHLAQTGQRVPVNDLWIAAIAAAQGLPVVTQDNDFDPIDGIAGVTVIKV